MSSWFGAEPTLPSSLPFSVTTPGTACIVASPRSIPGLSDSSTWIFHTHVNQPGIPITMGTYVVVHLEAADFYHPDEPYPQAQGRIDTTVYLNNDWLAFRLIDSTLGTTYWLAMPHKIARLSLWQRLRGWWAGQCTLGTPLSLPALAPATRGTQVAFPEQSPSTLTLPSSQVSTGGERGQEGPLPGNVKAQY